MKIIGVLRPSLYGDIVCSLPFLNWLEKQYPKSYKCAYVDLKCSQISPLLLNHPLIDRIQISEESDKLSVNDKKLFDTYDLVFEPYAPIIKEGWFNEMSVVESTFKMSWASRFGRIDPKEWHTLSKEEKCPRLYQWFPVQKNNYIAIWAGAGYNNSDPANQKRNPSPEYWRGLVDRLIKEGYKVAQLGIQSLSIDERVLNLSHYSLFDAVKFTLGTICSIGVDSGSQHIVASYGHPQVVLSTYWRNGHITNEKALIPINHKNNLKLLFEPNDINSISYDNVIEATKELQ